MDTDDQTRPSKRSDFKVAIICTLPLEADAVIDSLDEVWLDAPPLYRRTVGDPNSYTFGRSGGDPVVVVTPPGSEDISTTIASLRISFISIELALLTGICGAIPFKPDGAEVILGDVVISTTVVESDPGQPLSDGFSRRKNANLSDGDRKQNRELVSLSKRLNSSNTINELRRGMVQDLQCLHKNHTSGSSYYPTTTQDKLYDPSYTHQHNDGCAKCSADLICTTARVASCTELGCDNARLIPRSRLSLENAWPTPQIHFGSIETSDKIISSAKTRDEIAQTSSVLAFQNNRFGISASPCLFIKGVCHYADGHMNNSKEWQRYAAAVAASVTKEVLRCRAPAKCTTTSDSKEPLSVTPFSPFDPMKLDLIMNVPDNILAFPGQTTLDTYFQSHEPQILHEAQPRDAPTRDIPTDSGYASSMHKAYGRLEISA